MSNFKQGQYKVKNREKYKGNADNVIWRSSWEMWFCCWLDKHDFILGWKSEETIIPYISPVDNKPHRYFVDFWIQMLTKDGIREFIIEIKPFAQTKPPKIQKRRTKQYVERLSTFVVNQAKWQSAEEYAKQRNMTFQILTEKELFKTKNKY